MKLKCWWVFLNGEHIDSVYYTANLTQEEVLDSLVNYDGFDFGISIYEEVNLATFRFKLTG